MKNSQIEDQVICTILSKEGAMDDVVDRFRSENPFQDVINHKIYEACQEVHKERGQCDLFLVIDHMKRAKELESIGGVVAVSKKTDGIPLNDIRLSEYCLLISQKWLQKMLKDECQQTSEEVTMGDSLEVYDSHVKRIDDIADKVFHKRAKRLQDVTKNVVDRVSAMKGGVAPGTMVDFHDIDEHVFGFRGGDLILIAGRPGMGKTTLGLQFAYNIAKRGEPAAIFSLEMSSEQLMTTLMCWEAEIPPFIIRQGKVTDGVEKKLIDAKAKIDKMPLHLIDTRGLTLKRYEREVRRLHRKEKIKAVVLDYIQLMQTDSKYGNRNNDIGEISQMLKRESMDADIPTFALSQLSREVEKRTNKRPWLSDLRDSGSLEQDADMVLFPFRPGYYEKGNEGLKYHAELEVAKFRNGDPGKLDLRWNPQLIRFENKDESVESALGYDDNTFSLGGDEQVF